MPIINATDVLSLGGWPVSQSNLARLATVPFIPAGDSWLNGICKTNGYSGGYADVTDTDKQTKLQAAGSYKTASVFALTTQTDDFDVGLVKSKRAKAAENVELANKYEKLAKDCIEEIGFIITNIRVNFCGGGAYHPSGQDDTNVDFRNSDSSTPFDILGGEGNS